MSCDGCAQIVIMLSKDIKVMIGGCIGPVEAEQWLIANGRSNSQQGGDDVGQNKCRDAGEEW